MEDEATIEDNRWWMKIFPRFKRRPLDHPMHWIIVVSVVIQTFLLYGLMGTYPLFLKAMSLDPNLGEGRDNIVFLTSTGTIALALSRVVSLFSGFLVGVLGSQPLLVISAFCVGFAFLFSSFVTSVGGLLAVFVIFLSLAIGGSFAPMVVATLSHFQKYKVISQGCIVASTMVGMAIMSIVANALLEYSNGDWRYSFRILALFSIPIIICSFFTPIRADEIPRTPPHSPRVFSRFKMIFHRTFATLFVHSFFASVPINATGYVVVAFSRSQGLSPYEKYAPHTRTQTALLLTISGLCGVPGQLLFGIVSDKFGRLGTHIGLLAVQGAIFFAWGAFKSADYWGIGVTVACLGFFRQVALSALCAQPYVGHHMGEAVAWIGISGGIAGAVGPIICSALGTTDQSPAFFFLGACSIVAALTGIFLPVEKQEIYVGNEAFVGEQKTGELSIETQQQNAQEPIAAQ